MGIVTLVQISKTYYGVEWMGLAHYHGYNFGRRNYDCDNFTEKKSQIWSGVIINQKTIVVMLQLRRNI